MGFQPVSVFKCRISKESPKTVGKNCKKICGGRDTVGCLERENGQIQVKDDMKSKSKETQAMKLFTEGKDSVYVKIALDLPAEEVESIYLEFLKLKDMHTLVDVHDEMGNHLSSFVELFRIFYARGLGKNEIIEVLRVIVSRELPYLQEKVDYLRNHVCRLEHEQKNKEYHLSVIDKRINDLASDKMAYEIVDSSIDWIDY